MYLRLSVSERCNFHCRYCRPAGGSRARPPLDDRRLLQLVDRLQSVVTLDKVRLTGGEPLQRRGLPSFVRRLRSRLPRARLCATSNGSMLGALAAPLRGAGLDSVNISLDSLDEDRFSLVTGGGKLSTVRRGIDAALEAGFDPVKLNVVLQRSVNGDQLVELVRFAARRRCAIRFIELMPYGIGAALFEREYLSATRALESLGRELPFVERTGQRGTADLYLVGDGQLRARVGLIRPISQPFCRKCDRLRLDSRGRLYSCMRQVEGIDLAAAEDPRATERRIRAAISSKRPVKDAWPTRSMSTIGG